MPLANQLFSMQQGLCWPIPLPRHKVGEKNGCSPTGMELEFIWAHSTGQGLGPAPASDDIRQNTTTSALHVYCLRKYKDGFKAVIVLRLSRPKLFCEFITLLYNGELFLFSGCVHLVAQQLTLRETVCYIHPYISKELKSPCENHTPSICKSDHTQKSYKT